MKISDCMGNGIAVNKILPALDAYGVIFLSEAGCDDLVMRLASLLRIHPHPHAAENGWTFIQPDENTRLTPRMNGFTNSGLLPHTDRSLLVRPPSLLCFLLLEQSASGGETLLADTAAASRKFSSKELSEVQETLWLVDGSGRHRQRVVSIDRSLCRYRYRNDPAGFPWAGSQLANDFLSELQSVAASAVQISLRPGEGYLVHNHRILHGRTAFTGARRGARLLAFITKGSPHVWLNNGFRIRRKAS